MMKIKPKAILTGVLILTVKQGSEGLDTGVSEMNLGLSVPIIQEACFPSQESSSVSSDMRGSLPPGHARWMRQSGTDPEQSHTGPTAAWA